MSNQPLISAIIIFLNEERFLEAAIASVFSQTYPYWELLLVDDGSTDGSTAIAKRYAAQYPERVRYLQQESHQNLGMSAALKLGIRQAKGDYVTYLDADDQWLPHKIEQQLSLLLAHPEAALVYGPLQQWYSWTGKLEDQGRDRLRWEHHPFGNMLVAPPKLLALFLEQEEFIPSGCLFKQEALQQGYIYEDNFRDMYSDAVGLVKICLRSAVYVSREPCYLYRRHSASSTYRNWQNGQLSEARLAYLTWVANYFEQQQVTDPELLRVLHRQLWRCQHPRLSHWLNLKQQVDQLERVMIWLGRHILPLPVRHWLWNQWENFRYRLPRRYWAE